MQTLKLTKKYETYPEYKDSGVEWLGNVPKDWETTKARKFIIKIEPGIWGDDPKQNKEDIKCLRVADFDFDKLSYKNVETVRNNLNIPGKKILKDGDILIEKSGGGEKQPVGRAILFSGNEIMTCANFIDIVRLKTDVLPKFFTYQLYAAYTAKLNLKSIKQNTGIQNLDIFSYFSEMYLVPTYDQQAKIVKYLDKKVDSVDQIIKQKQKQIELLKERRNTVINLAVDCVDGKIEKLKYIAPERKIKLLNAPANVKYIGLENVESGTGNFLDSVEKTDPESAVDVFKNGDVLFGKLRPYLAKVLVPDFGGVCSGEFLTLIPKTNKITSKFLFYKLLSKDFIKSVNDSTYGTKMPRANWQFIGNQVIKYPSLDKQLQITQALDSQMDIFEKSISKITKSNKILQEFKFSLISNVVTGKIKI